MSGVRELLSSPTSVGVWSVVPDQSTIGFRCKSMWGLMPVKGRFTEFNGDGQITDTQTIFGRVDIKAASVETGIGRRDRHLRSADFFDVDKFPDLSVVVTSAEDVDGDAITLRAQLTVLATTATVPLRTDVAVLDDGAVRVSAQATIDRMDFSVGGSFMGMVAAKTTISGDIVFRRAAG